MFKKTKWLSITLASLLLTGCGGSNDTTNTIPTIIESESITSPLVENNTTDTTSPVVIENNTTNTTPPTVVNNNTTDTTTSPVVVENNTTNTTPLTVENNNTTNTTTSPVVVESNTTNTTPPTVENNTTNTQVALTIYEDAQDGLVDGWVIYKEDNETNISNIYDVDKASNVIKLERGIASTTYFVLGDKNKNIGWANSEANGIQWDMKVSDNFKITIYVETTNGSRLMKYDDANIDRGHYDATSIHYGLGTATKDGLWRKFERNLALDIQQAESNNSLISINGFRIDGSLSLDNIALQSAEVGADVTAPIITLNGNAQVTLIEGETYNDAGATAIDNREGTVAVTTTSNVNSSIIGNYTVTYTATDSVGNSSLTTRMVTVTSSVTTPTVVEPIPVIDGSSHIISVPNDYATISQAIANANDGDTIILEEGTHIETSAITINQSNLTIASRYLTTGDERYIASTILQGNNDSATYMFNGNRVAGHSENIRFIGLTVKETGKFITFTFGDHNVVDHCVLDHIKRDAVSFDTSATGNVTYCKFDGSGDDAIDVDTNKGETGGSFEIAHNEILNSYDDGIEIHLWYYQDEEKIKQTMNFNIHDNVIKTSGSDGIQLIDFDKTQDYAGVDPHQAIDLPSDSNRAFNVYNNIIENNGQVGVGAIFQSSQHEDSGRDVSRHFSGANMNDFVSIHDNIFTNNVYHVLGGDNMRVENNSFNNASAIAVKRVKGESVILNNTMNGNAKDFEDSNN